MASFSKGTSFTDGVTGDVTAAKLHALVDAATPVAGLVTDRTAETSVASGDLVLISDASDSNALKKMTVTNLFKTDVSITSGTGTAGTVAIGPTGDTNTGLFFPAADTIAFSEGGAEAMRIDSSGQVGIGGTPSSLLHLQGTSPALRIQAASGNSGVLDFYRTASVNSGQIASDSNNALVLSTNTSTNSGRTERLRIDSSGNVLVGTTDSGLSTGVGFKIQYDNGSTLPRVGVVINATGDSNYHLYNTNATYNGYRFYVSTNGGIANYSANNSNLSDERLKTDIVNSGDYLEKICSIPVRTFK